MSTEFVLSRLHFLTCMRQALGGSVGWRLQHGATGKTFIVLIAVGRWKDSLNFLFCLKNESVSNGPLTSCED